MLAVLVSSEALFLPVFPLFSHALPSVSDYVFISSLYKDTSPMGLGHTLLTTFNSVTLKALSPSGVTF